ncbi:MAG: hypothetical protein R3A44_35045 [Caldilineaceae bacterium]
MKRRYPGLIQMLLLFTSSVAILISGACTMDIRLLDATYTEPEPFYLLPADINDFPDNELAHEQLLTLWNQNMQAFNAQGITGNPWSNEYDAPRINYLDPSVHAKAAHIVHPITWTAFPNRVDWYFSTSQGNPYQISKDLLYPLADEGRFDPDDLALKSWVAEQGLATELEQLLAQYPELNSKDLSNFAPLPVPSDLCPTVNWNQPKDEWSQFGPPGPRGWKDEYNEWVTTRNGEGKITKISFTSENPEYWFSLWEIDPNKVLALYQELVGEQVTVDDLYLKDESGNILHDHRGHPVYNPLNQWNYGNRATAHGGGAVHLTSPPNTVGAEIYLAAAATLVRDLSSANYSPQDNICKAQYGANFRNSDPNIGLQANQVVRTLKHPIALANPISLYMQRPDFSNYVTPDGTPAGEFFHIVRGRTAAEAGTNYDQILHAVFEVPADKNYTVSDIKIAGKNIWWGSQMAETFNQALAATAFTDLKLTDQPPMPAVTARANPNPGPQPLVKEAVLQTISNTHDLNSATIPLLPVTIQAGETIRDMALEALDGGEGADIQYLHADGMVEPGIHITVTAQYPLDSAVVPGKHKIYDTYVYVLDITVDKQVPPGQYGVQVTNPGKAKQVAVPGGLIILPANDAE